MRNLYSQCGHLLLNLKAHLAIGSPPKIKTVRILDNPFPDIVPRITAEEKRAQQRAREAAQKEREQEMRLRGAKKLVPCGSYLNPYSPKRILGTLSFLALVTTRKKPNR
jgi:hypothetical protein